MSRKDTSWEDDGRTIADMSGVSGPSMFRPRKSENREKPEAQPERPWENQGATRREQWMMILGAMKATLLIASVFLLGLAAAIFLMLKLWT